MGLWCTQAGSTDTSDRRREPTRGVLSTRCSPSNAPPETAP
jgi:hypothetical protein